MGDWQRNATTNLQTSRAKRAPGGTPDCLRHLAVISGGELFAPEMTLEEWKAVLPPVEFILIAIGRHAEHAGCPSGFEAGLLQCCDRITLAVFVERCSIKACSCRNGPADICIADVFTTNPEGLLKRNRQLEPVIARFNRRRDYQAAWVRDPRERRDCRN